jgi:hypothetical protein
MITNFKTRKISQNIHKLTKHRINLKYKHQIKNSPILNNLGTVF